MKSNQKPLILVTNDDGITAKGIRLLIETAKKYGEVLVVAPDSHQSAKSHSITQAEPISYRKLDESENYQEYSCSGTPVDCVKIAIHEICSRVPDLVLSGINHGANTSVSVLYSGTMAAAIEATMNGMPGVGFSVNNYKADSDYSKAVPFIEKILDKVIKQGLPKGVSLNVNFPDTDATDIKGIKICRASDGAWKEKFVSSQNPHGQKSFWITGTFNNLEEGADDTDEHAILNGFASVVPIKPEFTAHNYIKELEKWGL
ncbi:MAG: 5'/3'-nucleotidase SurE [Bacteroidota bacterium]|nr:5'/3'-nucleotidase SurE [Bacteroidota bacterium]